MRFAAIVAENPDMALARVHEELGPDAVVVRVRKLRPQGISWLWRSGGKIEVTACVSEKREVQRPAPERGEGVAGPIGGGHSLEKRPVPSDGRWRSIGWLESNGLLPAFGRQLEEKIRLLYGGKPLPAMQTEWTAVTDLIICHWLPARQSAAGTGRPHVFIGPPGSGKTTALCKWMTSAILSGDERVRVWRLDADSANSGELLELHCELMGVPVERFWNDCDSAADLQFVDLPGVDIQDRDSLCALSEHLSILPEPHVHLVLNAAYESVILFEQFRAFESFKPEDIIFTHLDEEQRRVKLWNFVLGTKCPISFLGAGQKIPGEFRRAEPALLFPQKTAGKR